MDDNYQHIAWATLSLGALMAIARLLFARHLNRVDRLERKVIDHIAMTVPREEIDRRMDGLLKKLDDMQSDRQRMNDAVLEAIRSARDEGATEMRFLRGEMQSIHLRIDNLQQRNAGH